MKLFLATLQFMTRIPVPQTWTEGLNFDEFHKGIIWFPTIGAVIGVISTLVFYLCHGWFGWNAYVCAALYVMTTAMVNGGFHLDGLADTFDGIFSARKRERMLEIMKDSRLGTHGALALIFVLLLKVLFIAQLATTQPHHCLALLFTAPVVSRACMAIFMYGQTYARKEGLGNIYIGHITRRNFLWCLGIGLAFSLVLGGSVIGVLVSLGFAYLYRNYITHILGGHTGDTLGAGNELVELIYLLGLQL